MRGLVRLKATVDKNQKGFGFLQFENRDYEDAFVPPRDAERLFHGDRVEVTITPDGEVVGLRVLEHRFRELVGRYSPHPIHPDRGGRVIYERKKAREEITITQGVAGAREGDWVRVKLHFQKGAANGQVTGDITEVYGPELPPSADLGMVAAEYNLIEEHSKEAVAEAQALRLEIPGKDLEGRKDLREVPFITIDGETARDFDDAIYVERGRAGQSARWILWVGIADVSHYVKVGTKLDDEARSRGTSVYFPERAFHMLPRALSENLCSLKPDEPRLSMVARMEFDGDGHRGKTEIYEAVILSQRRATYNQIQAEWEANRTNPQWEYAPHFELYDKIRKMRNNRGSIDFDLAETEIHCRPTGEIDSISRRERLDAHRLIEEFMIAANEAVTDWMMERDWPFIYRVHEEPSAQSLERFSKLANTVGLDVSLESGVDPRELNELVKSLEGHPAQVLLNTALLRSMRQAIYSATHGTHFGLASPGYTHFTSPIRRYPDLVVHRMIRRAVAVEAGRQKFPQGGDREALEQELESICEHCSYRERLAADAERESIRLKKVRAMIPHVGSEFEAKITGLGEIGMFAELQDPFVEGLVLRDSMEDDFYEFNEERMVFYGKRKRRTFKIGDLIRIRVERADLDRREINFAFLDGPLAGSPPAPNLSESPMGRGRRDQPSHPRPRGRQKRPR